METICRVGSSPSEENPDPLVEDAQTGKEHDARNALPYYYTKLAKTEFPSAQNLGMRTSKRPGRQVRPASSWVGR